MDEIYGGDEESMIPKGLLDGPWDKSDEPLGDRSDFQNANALHYSVPCFIALVPPEHPSNIGDRYQTNFNQSNEMHSYPPIPQQMTPNYGRNQANEYFFHYQRNARAFNVLQQQRHFQEMEYSWWNTFRTNQNFHPLNLGQDVRNTNNSRNSNTLLPDRMFIPLQPFATNRYHIDHQQRMSNSLSYFGYDSFPSQNSMSSTKLLQKNNTNMERGSQTELVNLSTNSNDEKPTKHERGSSMNSTEECFISSKNNEVINSQMTLQFSRCSLNDNYKSAFENFIDPDSFCNVAYNGCLQLEQLFVNINSKISHGLDLTEFCTTLKMDLTKSKPLLKNSNAAREMVIAFIQICYSWVSLNSVKTYKQNKTQCQVDMLNDCISTWENNSRALIQNIIIAIQNIPLEDSCWDTSVIKILKNNLNKTKNTESEQTNGLSKKRQNESDSDGLNYNWRRCCQNTPREVEKNETVECAMCQLIPETHKSYNESSFICDNFMKSLKKTQEKTANKVGNSQRYPNQKTKSSSPRGRFTLSLPQNYSKENISRNELIDKMYSDSQKKSKIPIPCHKDGFQINTYFSNFTRLTHFQKNFDENRSSNQQSPDKYNEKHIPFERIHLNNLEGSTLLENERNNKYNIPSSTNNMLKKESEVDSERSEINLSSFEKGKGKRYSQQYKKKINTGNSLKQSENDEKFEHSTGINSITLSKLYEILVGIKVTDLRKNGSEKLAPNDISKIQESLIDPVNEIAEALVRNTLKTVDEIVTALLSMFYHAKSDNKGNIMIMTLANHLEIQLLNSIYTEIGT